VGEDESGERVRVPSVLKEFQMEADSQRASLRRATVIASLVHPTVMPLLGLVQDSNKWYMQMPRLPLNLREWIQTHPGEQYKYEAVRILKELLQGIAFIHSRNIVHRDLKPENVMLDERLHPVITGFETSKKVNTFQTVTVVIKSTPGYTCPAFVMGKEAYSVKSEMYSFGVIMCELLTGKVMDVSEVQIAFQKKKKNLNKSEFDILKRLLAATSQGRPSAEDLLKEAYWALKCCI
jgi:serine/threonine protein kinase